jgi:hypothetical protein
MNTAHFYKLKLNWVYHRVFFLHLSSYPVKSKIINYEGLTIMPTIHTTHPFSIFTFFLFFSDKSIAPPFMHVGSPMYSFFK